ncbi:ComEA family DNA-binding protein [Mycoplasmatota bacterium]|nr:ComEA family DNA-binding protein [Mycoplasmatota bacterium]
MFDEIDKKSKWLIFLIITNIITISFSFYMFFDKKDTGIVEQEKIVVQISGEINHPDVYEVEIGTRLRQLIQFAGGFTEDANINAVNQAILLCDEMKISIPTIDNSNPNQSMEDGKININTADLALLMSLNGIGEVKAEAIIHFRDKYGYFKSIEEIQLVTGIGDKTYENIKDYICC